MFPKPTPVTKNIMILCAIVYIVSNIYPDLYRLFSAYYPFSPNFKSYQIITHMFMHAPFEGGAGITHILFNMLTLWSFGPVLEQTLGAKKFTALYFASGLGAFILFNIWDFVIINNISNELISQGINIAEIYHKADLNYSGDFSYYNAHPESLETQLLISLRNQMLGASGAIFGVVAAFSTLFPDAKLMFMFIPFPIKAKYLLPIIIVISLYLGFSGQMGNVAHFAHIGGALVGFLIARNWRKNHFRIR